MIYVAVENSNVLGFIAGIVEEVNGVDKLTVNLSKFGRVEELCVTDKIRSNGVGTLLMNKMEDYLKSKDCNYIYIDVFGPNIGAQNFYNKKGYNLRNVEVMKKID
jgi:GNAT superfamily N-acetyltransferase